MTIQVLTPVARLVQGSLYAEQTTGMDGQPLVNSNGEPRSEWYFGIAIRKTGESHWNERSWGKLIWDTGCTAFRNAPSLPSFAWKITDGDSTIVNKKGTRPCDKEGFADHWILNLSCGFAPKIYNRDGTQPMPQPDAINPGDFIQVLINVSGNNSTQSPGVYLNHNLVAFQGYGDRITMSVDPRSVGFGQSELPPEASSTPKAALTSTMPPISQPHTAILNPPMPPLPSAPPVSAPVKVMTAKAAGSTYESFIAGGWNDAQMISEGYLQP